MKTMKELFRLALMSAVVLTSATLLTACSSDDDDETGGNGKSIVGEWVTAQESSTYMLTEVMNFSANGSVTDTTYELFGTNLTSDNPRLTEFYKDIDTGSYSVDGNKLILNFYGESETFTYSISSSGKNLTITHNAGNASQTITFERMTAEERTDIARIEEAYQQYKQAGY